MRSGNGVGKLKQCRRSPWHLRSAVPPAHGVRGGTAQRVNALTTALDAGRTQLIRLVLEEPTK